MIFLDNASTMRVSDKTVSAMSEYLREEYFNPSALYTSAVKVNSKLNEARNAVAKRLNAEDCEIFFTSCATESNTWALQSGFKNKNGNIVVGSGEHASVYENAVVLKSKGYDVRFAPLNNDGTVNFDKYTALIDENTCLISIIHCSNETGAINDLKKLSEFAHKINQQIIFHSDGVQAFGKLDNDCQKLRIDMYSISAHKIGGPKGVGALFVRSPIKLAPLLIGGGQESGRRAGTENTAGIVGFMVALEEFSTMYNNCNISLCKKHMEGALQSVGGQINSAFLGAPNILSVSFEGLRSEILQRMASDQGVLIGLGSACSSKSKHNRILSEMGLTQKQIDGSIRISFSAYNSMEETVEATKIIVNAVNNLRGKIFG